MAKAPGRVLARPDDLPPIAVASSRLVGSARVFTDDQTTALQLDALKSAGCAIIHEDSASGAARSRPGLNRAISELAAGDTPVVWRLDRLGRSLRDLLDLPDSLRDRGVALRSLADHIDTGTAAGQMLYACSAPSHGLNATRCVNARPPACARLVLEASTLVDPSH